MCISSVLDQLFVNLKSLISPPTCFQSRTPKCIDLILTNQEDLLNNSNTFKVEISDHHHLVSTMRNKEIRNAVLKRFFKENIISSKKINFRGI